MKHLMIALFVAMIGVWTPSHAQLSGNITTNMTLPAYTQHLMSGCVVVKDGAQLTIEEGVKICAEEGSSLTIEPGGQLEILGTNTDPVIFTSNKANHLRSPGDWGGIRIMGKSIYNNGLIPIDPCTNQLAGGNISDDYSGKIEHLKIHYAGKTILSNKLINNAFTLAAVGSQTIINHIEVAYSAENGIGFIGGNVPVSDVFLFNNYKNDLFFSDGNQSEVSKVLAIRNDMNASHIEGSNGIYLQNNSTPNFTGIPGTRPYLNHLTLLGPIFCGTTTNEQFKHGILFDRNAGGRVENSVIAGFNKSGLFINDELSAQKTITGELQVEYTSFTNNGSFDYNYNLSNINWLFDGCGDDIEDWIEYESVHCAQMKNQFSSFNLGYDPSFCMNYCESGFNQQFKLDTFSTQLAALTLPSELSFRGAIQEIDLFDWISTCPSSILSCNNIPSTKMSKLEVYPNPSTTTTHLHFEANERQTVHLRVLEISTGRTLIHQQIKIHEGTQMLPLPTHNLKEGTYQIHVHGNNEIWQGKLEVQ